METFLILAAVYLVGLVLFLYIKEMIQRHEKPSEDENKLHLPDANPKAKEKECEDRGTNIDIIV